MNDDWKDTVRAAFEEHTDPRVVYVDCCLFDQDRRLEVSFILPNGSRKAIGVRGEGRFISIGDIGVLRSMGGKTGEAAADMLAFLEERHL